MLEPAQPAYAARRQVLALLTVVAVLAVVQWIIGSRPPDAPGHWPVLKSPRGGFSLRHPPGWTVESYDDHCGAGILATNLPGPVERAPTKTACAWDLREAPDDLAALQFQDESALASLLLSFGDQPVYFADDLPLDLREAQGYPDPPVAKWGAPMPEYQLLVKRGDRFYMVRVWMGRAVSDAARLDLARIAASIGFEDGS